MMGAPKGNKFAVGSAGGAPRSVSLSPEEMIKLGQEMVEWVKSHPEMLHLSEWYTIEKMYTYKQWKAFIQLKEFLPYYEIALKLIGRKYLDKTSNIRDSISQRWQRVYFADLREEEDETARYMQSLKLEELEKQSPEVLEKFSSLMDLMKNNQDRKIEETKSNEESKS